MTDVSSMQVMRTLRLIAAVVLLVGCSALPIGGPRPTSIPAPLSPPVATLQPEGSPSDAPSPAPVVEVTPTPPSASSVPLCDDVPIAKAPAEWYRDEPIYVGDSPTQEVRAWAATKPGFEEIWIDREHFGWVALAFSRDAEARQQELRETFPDLGAVIVPVDWTKAELQDLERRVSELGSDVVESANARVHFGVVDVFVGYLTPERVALIEEHFGGERVCLAGAAAGLEPAPGPQAQAGDGWRLLADADGIGPWYRTGIAYDAASYAELWGTLAVGPRGGAEVPREQPAVDFQNEVVIFFGVVTGSICPPIRMDDVVVDLQTATVYPEIVHLDFGACTDDIHPHAYVVALQRSRLPGPPFTIQLRNDRPVSGERTVVEADLREPGSTAQPNEIHGDDSPPEPHYVGPGGFVETCCPTEYQQSAHCGLEWLGPLNDVNFRTSEADGADWIPAEWQDLVDERELIVLRVQMTEFPPTLEAKANGRTVIYEATAEDPPGCD